MGYATNGNLIQIKLGEILKNNDNCVFVATENKEVIGWIHGFYTIRVESDSFVEIGGLVVDKKYQNMGVGKKLVEKIHCWANSLGCNNMRVRCNTKRKEAHIFYEKIGFELNKEQKVFGKKLIV